MVALLSTELCVIKEEKFSSSNIKHKKMKAINKQAPVQSSQSILISSSVETVWNCLTDINNWARWQTDISRPILTGETKPSSSFQWKTGGVRIQSLLHTVETNQFFGWTGKTFGLYAIHNWTLTVENGQVRVAVDESMEGFLARLFKTSFQKNLETGMRNWLQLLKKESEQREPKLFS